MLGVERPVGVGGILRVTECWDIYGVVLAYILEGVYAARASLDGWRCRGRNIYLREAGAVVEETATQCHRSRWDGDGRYGAFSKTAVTNSRYALGYGILG